MIRTIVPLIGREALDKIPYLWGRIQSVVEEDFGHSLTPVDAGSIYDLGRSNPLKVSIPFCIEVAGVTDPLLVTDWMAMLTKTFPSLTHIIKRADFIPVTLKEQAVALSLGHVNGSPPLIRNAVRIAYKRISDPSFGTRELSRELAVSKATLERTFQRQGLPGAGHLLTRIKMEEAKRMVLETTAPINEIALAVGYENLASFDRRFCIAWGCSPTQMRQNAKSVSQNANVRQSANKLS